MGIISKFLSTVGEIIENLFEIVATLIGSLLALAIWAVSAVIELATDILGWINRGLKSLLDDGATEVNVVKGSALVEYINAEKAKGNYTAITLSDLNAMRTSVVNVAMDENGRVVDDQTIRSSNGLSYETERQFNGNSILTVKI